jgi:hypothetical protein
VQLRTGDPGVQHDRRDGDPSAISRTSSDSVNGRPALAISALAIWAPAGWRAYTV